MRRATLRVSSLRYSTSAASTTSAVGSGCEGDKPCKGNRYNNSWEFAAQTCNRAGFSIAAVVDGLGAEIFCTLHDGSLDSLAVLDPQPFLDSLATFGLTCP